MAIHTIQIDTTITLEQLRKEFRKRLMTGGAVLRIRPGLTAAELEKILVDMVEDSAKTDHSGEELGDISKLDGVRAIVAQELLREPGLTPELKARIESLGVTPDVRVREMLDAKTNSAVTGNSARELRCCFLDSLGSDKIFVERRRRLAKAATLPADLVFLLGRDPDASVRFQLKFVNVGPERVYETSGATENVLVSAD